MSALVAGLVLGVAGSVHCLAMCGPLVAALAPAGARAAWYHAGRSAVYVALGLGAGAIGRTVTIAGFGRVLAFVMAAIIALQAVERIRADRWNWTSAWAARPWQSMSSRIRAFAATYPLAGAAGFGAMNGLVPCGLVYAATAAAIGFGAVVPALSFMVGFAIGTTPLLAAGAVSLRGLSRRLPALGRIAPVVLLLIAALLVVRGVEGWDRGAHLH
jgi:sulfite exporter TauE/SafE